MLGSEPLDINTNRFYLSELEAAIEQIKSSKAFGHDNIPALIWKDSPFNTFLFNLCKYIFSTHSPPSYDTSLRSYLCQKR